MFKNINKTAPNTLKYRHFFCVIIMLSSLSACIKNTELVGYTFKSEKLDQIKVGKTSREYVKNTLGTPSFIADYGDHAWYYISSEYETIAFLAPKVKSQKIIAINFGKDGMVNKINEYTAKDAQEIKLVKDTTNTEGRDVGLLGQLLGNVGRFNSEPGKPKKITPPRSVPH